MPGASRCHPIPPAGTPDVQAYDASLDKTETQVASGGTTHGLSFASKIRHATSSTEYSCCGRPPTIGRAATRSSGGSSAGASDPASLIPIGGRDRACLLIRTRQTVMMGWSP